jgi:protein kinase A
MGGGNTRQYVLHQYDSNPPDYSTSIEQVKLSQLKRQNSHPEILTTDTVFCPYVDLKMGKKGDINNVIQRRLHREKKSMIGSQQASSSSAFFGASHSAISSGPSGVINSSSSSISHLSHHNSQIAPSNAALSLFHNHNHNHSINNNNNNHTKSPRPHSNLASPRIPAAGEMTPGGNHHNHMVPPSTPLSTSTPASPRIPLTNTTSINSTTALQVLPPMTNSTTSLNIDSTPPLLTHHTNNNHHNKHAHYSVSNHNHHHSHSNTNNNHLQHANSVNSTPTITSPTLSHSTSSMIFDYKKCEYFELSRQFPWLLKNAHFQTPSMKAFESIRVIGAGRTSKVSLVKYQNYDYYCVVKAIKKSYIQQQKELRHIMSERDTLYQLCHPFVMKTFAEFEDSKYAYFAFEYLPGGELRSILQANSRGMPIDAVKFYMSELLLALEHLHFHQIVHRDVRPDNILLDEYGHIKLCDFGFAMKLTSNVNGKLYTICCPPAYLSPELLNSKFDGGYSQEVDIWAFGVVFYELLCTIPPFQKTGKESQYEIFLAILEHRMSFPGHVDKHTKDLLKKIFIPELDKRLMDIPLIQAHAVFENVDWDIVAYRQYQPPFIPQIETAKKGDSRYFAMTEGSAKHWKRLDVLENKLRIT